MKFSFQFIKTIFFLLLCISSLTLTAQHNQIPITSQQWQQDLRFLQETVHEKYPFLFKKVSAKDFDAKAEELYRAIPTMQDHEVMVGLLRMVSLFGYGHTDMGFRGGAVPYHKLPINLYQFSDGMYIEGGHQEYSNAIGAKVIAIEGMPVDDALKAIRPTVPAENDSYFIAFGINNLLIPEVLHAQGITNKLKESVSFTLEKAGKQWKQSIKAVPAKEVPRTQYSRVKQKGEWLSARSQAESPLYLKNLDKIYYYEYLPNQKTVYVRHSQIQNDKTEDIKTFYERVLNFIEKNDVEKFVLDVRLNGGGNNYLNKPIITGIIQNKKINQKGKFFTIIGRRTFSACQNLINELDNYTNVIFIGEPSAENVNFYGDNRKVTLPNSKFPVYLSYAWWQDKPQWENQDATVPHIAVNMSFEEYRSNQDPVLEAALNYTDTGFILDPMEHLTQLFIAEKYGQVRADAAKIAKDPAYRYYDFEKEFSKTGTRLLNNGQVEAAVFVLSLVAELYPTSTSAWYSAANAYEQAKQSAKAIDAYKKIIELDSKAPLATAASNRIKALEKK